MTVKLASLKADLAAEENGEWIDYPDWPGVAFNVRSLNASAYTNARDFMVQRLRRKYGRKPIPNEVMVKEAGKIYCKHILFGWRGLDVEYTEDAALETLSDPAYRSVVAAVEYCAGQVAQADIEFIEDATPKSGRPSVGA